MKIGGKYNLKGQSERLVYLGKSGHMRPGIRAYRRGCRGATYMG